MAKVEGHSDPQFSELRSYFEEQIAAGEELGASICVNIDGKNVVDIWGGWSDEAKTVPWTQDTIVNVWSSTKTIAALATLIQAERGALSVDDPVSKYWPEFGENGKDGVLVRHFLSHTSGVSGWEGPITYEEVYDWNLSVSRLAKQAPWWEPGTQSGYHSVTMGHLLGEIVKRTGGKPMKQFVAEEIAGPLKADFQIGALEKDWSRISPVIPPPPMFDFSQLDPDSLTRKTFANPPIDANVANTPAWRQADLPAVNGHTNARGLARMLSVITLGGTVDGVKLLSPETIDSIFRVQSSGVDAVIGAPLTFGIGYGLADETTRSTVPWLPPGNRICFWAGWGGSAGIMDLDRKITFAYTMNSMGPGVLGNRRTEEYFKKVYKALGVEGY
ncbi:uncharacterized protein Z518_04507 [Rhinocladiella mackenziei CBS 650.93]|uniref:Beta-lactamase-related domain-containing protein n=1 Tax=Rhinocladiella mackenziei CBS 650.93 TaxID=1442369 RepID=A0A0D2ITQ8_9EURO|nr:uncharacterized protein Z518_04507 [Rhinocladiella mackenziei CBS 650.93]KIX06531.1 hypothetical protein Z518_04507 [Rhinocladiella mackenziei CBS 650.93]